MDICDRAKDLEDKERDAALKKTLRDGRSTGPAASHCIGCGVEIPEDRRTAAPDSNRCLDCQNTNEGENP